ncbi:hypothetical protein BU24DRAFT_276058 [Aaosphaeria arxii CBS 175.79]|uniref:Frequency clock protein n=1 Tax=Aaosphaeria arxii CBS 175.79 TaxID=1450172 RepID=A0A6A5XH18_9PLEO|nr:uncharacterized protein BU24DRAFT_276058 [Aaosphaeria arxii CBS 175.79]KAF2012382.1 hypothetical protein BU24DRAFT_276058 [Aaosphaeria arxii CBS 175.79]
MNNPPGSIPARSTTPHPRRPPAHQSVSLRHSPPTEKHAAKTRIRPQSTTLSSPNPPASDKANPPSSVSPKITNKNSSGESSDAGRWFENTNNNAIQGNTSFADTDDPPFFLRNSSSSGTPPEGYDVRPAPYRQQSTSMPYRPNLAHLGTDGSSTEEFRSVIDDLTVANKKLKQKLKKYEKLYDAHLQDEKLFEVRFHGLPDHKKKELEDTLRTFAANLDDTSHNANSLAAPYPTTLDQHKTSSLNSRFAESGYASMPASGQYSNAPSGQTTTPSGHNSDRQMSRSQYSRQQQSIRSYLQDIPPGLLPKHNAAMSDKTKKKLIVRRLEQIFAGKHSVPGHHPQQAQQEEVAQSAATADREAKEATGQPFRKEGLREARIMPIRSEDDHTSAHSFGTQKLRPSMADQGSGSPDQRPTRPLDLDPYRAQVPAENMEYIRHLGFTPPDMESEVSPEEGHGWLYLNLLINMAQLHTINVTPSIVKEAVQEYSSKFELSHDGRKIRWKGGIDVTKNSDSSSERLSNYSPYDLLAETSSGSPSKRMKTEHSGHSIDSSSVDPEQEARRMARAAKERDQNKVAYTPLFFHKEDSDDENDIYNIDISSSNSPYLAQQRGDSSGFASSAMRSSSSRKRREDGPIIFYNKAKFCTDLSGDRKGFSVINAGSYKSLPTQPLGVEAPVYTRSAARRHLDNPSGIGELKGSRDSEPMDLDLDPKGARTTSSEGSIGFSPEALRGDSGDDSPDVMEFEASGLGGVQPDDNFSIKVRRSQQYESLAQGQHEARRSNLYPKLIQDALNDRTASQKERDANQPIVREDILSASRRSLPSSALPPASFMPFDSTSSGDVDSDLESDVSSGPSTSSSSNRDFDTEIHLVNFSPNNQGGHGENNDEEDGSSGSESDTDSSIDLLATARRLVPNTVLASEREYDADLAERLAHEIPAGSSAATAGGGSGFNTPVSRQDQGTEDGGSSKRPSNASGSASTRAKNLKRTRTSDGMANTQRKR